MKHRMQAPTPELVAETRIDVLEKLAHDLSVSVVKVGVERDAQAAIICRRNEALVSLAATAGWLLAAAAARPVPVLDTGTPGVEVPR